MASKADIRAGALARRALVSEQVRAEFAASLARDGTSFAQSHGARIIGLYSAIRGEADPSVLLSRLAAAGMVTALPETQARGEPLVFRHWRPGDLLVPGPWSIGEPAPHLPACAPDMLFVPLAAFDRHGHRIGYGGGHYDRALAQLRASGKVMAVGVAFSVQEVANLPQGAHDQNLDFVVTQTEWITCSRP